MRLSSTVERWIGQGGASTPAASTVTSASPSAFVADPSASTSYSVPPEARVQTEAGAVAFVTFYLGQVNAAWTTPDATLLPPLQLATCNSCAGFQADAVEFVTLGQRLARAFPAAGCRSPRPSLQQLNPSPGILAHESVRAPRVGAPQHADSTQRRRLDATGPDKAGPVSNIRLIVRKVDDSDDQNATRTDWSRSTTTCSTRASPCASSTHSPGRPDSRRRRATASAVTLNR